MSNTREKILPYKNSNHSEIENVLRSFFQYLCDQQLSNKSVKNYVSDARQYLEWLEKAENHTENSPILEEISVNSIQEYKSYLLSNAVPLSSINRYLASLRQFGSFLQTVHQLKLDLQQVSNISSTPQVIEDSRKRALQQFQKALEHEHCSTKTIVNYLDDINLFYGFFGTEDIFSVLTKPDIAKFLGSLEQKQLSLSTIARRKASLKRFATWANKSKYIKENPLASFSDSVIETAQRIPLFFFEKTRNTQQTEKTGEKKTVFQNIYSIYNSWPASSYLHLSVLVIFATMIGLFGYQQFFKNAEQKYAFPAALTRPNRVLSFQGRLTDSAQTPITSATSVQFGLYNHTTNGAITDTASTSGPLLWKSGTCTITPDQDGIFSTLLGSSCGAEIDSNVITENQNVYLAITVGAETLTPRQQIATVGYALNSETLQGYPASPSAVENTVLVMNNNGDVILGSASPILRSTSGTFAIEGNALTLRTNTGTAGNITLAPDGTGQLSFIGGTTSTDFLNITNANLTTGNLISGTVGNNNTGYKFLSFSGGSSPSEKFYVTATGAVTAANALTVPLATISATNSSATPLVINGTGGQIFSITNNGNITAAGTLTGLTGLSSSGTVNFSGLSTNGVVYTSGGNGTLNSEAFLSSSRGGTGANLSAATQGSIPFFSSTGVMSALAPNTAGYVLTTQGASANPTWTAASGIGTNYWQLNSSVLAPGNTNYDLAIGGNSTASAKFQVFGNTGNATTSGTLTFNGAALANNVIAAENMRGLQIGDSQTGNIIIPNGNVGIGTTNPGQVLEVNGNIKFSSTSNQLIFNSSSGHYITDTSGSLRLATAFNDRFVITNGGSFTSNMSTGSNFDLFDTSGNPNWSFRMINNPGTVRTRLSPFVTDGATAVAYLFDTNNSLVTQGAKLLSLQNAGVEKAYFNKDGGAYLASNVGIGTTSPRALLDVVGDASTSGHLTFRGATPNYIHVMNGTDFRISNSPGGDAGNVDRLTLTASGNVGIGTTNPLSLLTLQSTSPIITLGNTAANQTLGGTLDLLEATNANFGTTGAYGFRLTNDGSANHLFLQSGYDTTINTRFSLDRDSGNIGIGTTNANTLLQLGTAGTTAGTFSLAGGTSGLVTLQTAAAAGTWTMTLPTTGGTNNYVLSTNGSGVTSWSDPSSLVGSASFWQLNNKVLAPGNTTHDLAIGGDSTASAKFQVFGSTGNATTSGTLTFNGAALANNVIAARNMRGLQIGDSQTGNILFPNGNVGIGTTSPATKFDVQGGNINTSGSVIANAAVFSSSGGQASLYQSAGVSLNYWNGSSVIQGLVLNNAGNVGIGTTNPANTLSVNGVIDSGYTSGNGELRSYQSAASNYISVRTNSGTFKSGLFRSNTDFFLYYNTQDGSTNIDGTYNGGSLPGSIILRSLGVEKIRMDGSGNLGINTTSPTAKLDVVGDASTSGHLVFRGTTPDYIHVMNGADLRVSTSPGGDAGNVDRLTLLANGNVGIGTTNPGSKLEVYGPASTIINVKSNDSTGSMSIGDSGGIATRFYPTLTGWATGGASVPSTILTYVDNDTGNFPALVINSRNNGAVLANRPLLGVQNYNSAMLFQISANGNVGIGTTSPGTLLDIGSIGTTLGTMRLAGNTSGYVQIQPAAAAGSWTMTLPVSGGTNNYVLSTNGSGVTTWSDPSSLVGSASFWQLNNKVLAPGNTTYDLTIGGNATSSALFQVFGTTGNATTSGTLTFNGTTQAGNLIAARNMRGLQIGDSQTGNILFNGGNVGIGASYAIPRANLETGTIIAGGPTSTSWASINGTSISAANSVYSYQYICAGNGGGNCASSGGVTISAAGMTGTPNVGIAGSGNSYFNAGNVGIGTTGPVARLQVNTGADATIGQIIRANSATQSENLSEWQNSSGGRLAAVGPDGSIGIPNWDVHAKAYFSTTHSIDEAVGMSAVLANANVNVAQTNPQAALTGSIYNTHTTGTVGSSSGLTFNAYHTNAGTTTNLFGVSANALMGGNGTITNAYGIQATGQSYAGTGTINKWTGIYVDGWSNHANSTVNNSYGIYYAQGAGTYASSVVNKYGIYLEDVSNAGTGNYAIVTNAGNIVFNEGGNASTDFRVEGDTNANLLFVDASTDRIGIGTSAPGTLLQLGTAGSTAGTFSLAGGTSGLVTLQTAAAAGTWTMTLPTTGGTNNYVLTTNGSGVTSWSDTNSLVGSVAYWQLNNKVLSPGNSTHDIAIGGDSTASAKFQVFGTTGNATTSGTLTFNGATLANNVIAAENMRGLQIGDAQTGNILLAPNGGNIGIGTTNPTSPLHITRTASNYAGPSIVLKGISINGTGDNANGFGLYLSYNLTGNRQFVFANTESGDGVRFIGNTMDGFNVGTQARADLTIGTETNGAHIAGAVSNTQFSVSNLTGTASKIVTEIKGAAAQSGNYLNISSSSGTGDILAIKSTGNVGIGTTTVNYKLQVNGNGYFSSPGAVNDNALVLKQGVDGGRIRSILNAAGSEIYYEGPDGSNFHQYYGKNLAINFFGGATSAQINGNLSVSGFIYPANDIWFNPFSYATVGTPLTTSNALGFDTWAWNGSDGYSIASASKIYATQLDYTNQHAQMNFNVGNTVVSTLDYTGKLYVSGNVGIGSVTPGYPLDVVGYVNSSSGFCIAGDCKTSWATAGTNYWQLANKVIAPGNTTHDLAIGGNSTASAKFQVFGLTGNATTAGTLTFNGATLANNVIAAENMRGLQIGDSQTGNILIPNGRVGIGDNNPLNPLAVSGTFVDQNTGGTIKATSTNAFGTGVGGFISLGGEFNTGSYANFASIGGVKENATAGNYAGALTFYSRANSAVPVERMRISSAGNVGIGTTAPTSQLHLNTVQTDSTVTLQSDPSYLFTITNRYSSANQLTMGGIMGVSNILDVNNSTLAGDYTLVVGPSGGAGSLALRTANVVRMFIDRVNGNVGIGTTDARAKLDVIGDASASGHLTLRGATPNYLHILNGTDFRISSSPGGDVGNVDRLTLTAGGNVGIGVTNPTEILDIAGNKNISIGGYTNLGQTYSQAGTVLGYNAQADTINNVSDQVLVSTTNAGIGYQYIRMSSSGGMQFHLQSGSVTGGDVASAEKMRLTAAGNLGIGTTTVGAKLEVYSGGIKLGSTVNANNILDTAAAGGAPSGILYWGNRQICDSVSGACGTASAVGFANITSGTNTAAAMVVGTGASLNYTGTGTINASSLIGATWVAPGTIGSTTPNTGAFTTLSSTSGSNFATTTGNVGIGTTGANAKLDVIGNIIAGTNSRSIFGQTGGGNTLIQMNTGSNSIDMLNASSATMMRILGTGEVGIGTTAPASKLHIESSGGAFITIQRSDSVTANGGLRFRGSDNLVDAEISYNNIVGGTLSFLTGAGGATTKMNILDNGNVGIGTTAPSAKLDVTGTSDIRQFIVKANGTQTNNLQEWQNSAGTSLSYVTGTGFLKANNIGGLAGNGTTSYITDLYNQSRGMNLMTNGSGLLGNNYNFSGWTFDQVNTHGGKGSFKNAVFSSTALSDELTPVDGTRTYKLSLWANSTVHAVGSHAYFGVAPYNIDGQLIATTEYMRIAGTDTTLAQQLNPGDTVIHLTSAANWKNAAEPNYQHQIQIFDYTNSFGYTYPAYTYTRHLSYNYANYATNGAWVSGGITGNDITLTEPWPAALGTVPVGTAVSNGSAGGGYKYIAAGNVDIPNAWTNYTGLIGGWDTTGSGATNVFPLGTAYVKFLALLNRDVAGNTTNVSDVWLSEVTANNIEVASATQQGVVALGNQQLGTGDKYFAGNVGIGTTTATNAKLEVYGGAIKLGSTVGTYNILNTAAAGGAPSGALYWGNRQICDSVSGACGTASAVSFASITSGTNSTAAMVVNTGASLTYSGTGTINASSLVGATWVAPGTIGSTTPNTGAFTTLSSTSGSNFATTTGNVGIGTTAPRTKLELTSAVGSAPSWNAPPVMILNSSTAAAVGVGPGIAFRGQTGNASTNFDFASIQGAKDSAVAENYGGRLVFATQDAAGNDVISERMRITSTGNVGVGTTSPTEKFEVSGGIFASGYNNTSTNTLAATRVGRYTGGSPTYGFIQAPYQETFNIWTSGSNNIASFGLNGSASDTRSVFYGNVGIGTTAPGSSLHSYSTTSTNGLFETADANNTTTTYQLELKHYATNGMAAGLGSGLKFSGKEGSTTYEFGNIQAIRLNASNGTALTFSTRDNSATVAERLRIDNAGNVGIGTTTTSNAKLEVYSGGIKLGSTVNANNILDTAAAGGAPSGILYWGNRQICDSVSGACGTASAVGFANITSGTNTAAAMVVGTGASLAYNGATAFSGGINANYLENIRGITTVEALRANNTLTGGGTITIDGSNNLSWTSRFIAISNGRGSTFGTVGYFDITQPSAGTAITGVGGATSTTWSASGITIGAWQALYYILPIGSAQTSVAANFRLVSYTSDLDIPADWILIAKNNADTAYFKLGTGLTLKTGQSYATGTYSDAYVPNTAQLLGATWAAPGTIGSTTPNTGAFTTLSSTSGTSLATTTGNVGIGTTGPLAKLTVGGFNDQDSVSIYSPSNNVLSIQTTLDGGALGNGGANAFLTLQHLGGRVGIGTSAPGTLLQLGTAGTTAGTLSMAGGTSGLVTLQTAAVAGTWTMTLPTTGGTNNYVLSTNGSGVTTWSDPSSLVGAASLWQLNNKVIAPGNTTHDLSIGGTATSSAKFLIAGESGATMQSQSSVSRYKNVFSYSNNTEPITGAMVVNMPNPGVGMLNIRIHGYNYTSNVGAWEAVIGGYWYSSGPSWINTSVEIRGSAPFKRVRLMTEGGNPRIVLGETTDVWNYPQISVDIENAGYASQTSWLTGWTGAITNDISALTASSEPLVKMYITSTGNVGIGTTTAPDKLTVSGNIKADAINVTGTAAQYYTGGGVVTVGNSGSAYGAIYSYSDTSGTGRALALNPVGGNVGIGTTVPSGLFHAKSASALNAYFEGSGGGYADIHLIGTGTQNYIESDDSLDIWSGNASRIFVKSDGNIGIGSTAPGEKLDIAGNATTSGKLTFNGSTLANNIIAARNMRGLQIGDSQTGNILFPNGNIGIGTTNPLYTLQVVGTSNLGGATTFGGNLLPSADNTYDIGSTSMRWKTLHVGPGSVVVHNDNTDGNKVSLQFSGATAQLVTNAATPLQLTTGTNPGINIDTAGNVGIGTTASPIALTITGTASTSGNLVLGGDLMLKETGSDIVDALGIPMISFSQHTAHNLYLAHGTGAGKVSIGSGTPGSKLSLFGNASIGSTYGSSAAPTNGLIVEGNVGIGTTAPTDKLNISGGGIQLNPEVDITNDYGRISRPATSVGTGAYGGLVVFQDRLYGFISYTMYRYDGGTTWTSIGNACNGSTAIGAWKTVIYHNTLVIACGDGGNTNAATYVYYDGSSFTSMGIAAGAGWRGPTGLAVYNDKVYSHDVQGYNYRWDGGTTWTSVGGTYWWGNLVVINGEMYNDPDTSTLYRYNGSSWLAVSVGAMSPGFLADYNGQAAYRTDAAMGTVSYYNPQSGTLSTLPAIPSGNVNQIISYNGFTYAFSSTGYVYRLDGKGPAAATTWTQVASVGGSTGSAAVYNGTLYFSNGTDTYKYTDFETSYRPDLAFSVSDEGSTSFRNNVFIGSKLDISGDSSTSGHLVFRGATPNYMHVLNGADLRISNSPGGDAGNVDRLTLAASGNVGIGTTVPNNKVEIGAGVLGTLTGTAFALSDTGANSTIGIGQSSTARGRLTWIYNATPANAYMGIGDALGTHNLVLQDAGGNVGIGTTTANVKLDVAGSLRITGAGSDLPANTGSMAILTGSYTSPDAGRVVFGDNTGWKYHFSTRTGSVTTDRLTIMDTGNVGIGVTAPTAKLHALGEILADGNSGIGNISTYYGSGGSPAGGATIGSFNFTGNATRLTGAQIQAITANAWGGSNTATHMVFNTVPTGGSTTLAERMRITADGNVGIGTTSSLYKLDVQGTFEAGGNISSAGTFGAFIAQSGGSYAPGTSTSGALYLASSGSTNYGIYQYGGGYNYLSGSLAIGTVTPGNTLDVVSSTATYTSDSTYQGAFGTGSYSVKLGYDTTAAAGIISAVQDGSTWTNLAIQPNAGNVGIGTVTPGSYKLDVNGALLIRGHTTLGDGNDQVNINREVLNDANEGGQINWVAGTSYTTMVQDLYQRDMRVFADMGTNTMNFSCFNTNATGVCNVITDGTASDFAETIPTTELTQGGDILVSNNATNQDGVTGSKARNAYDKKLLGVVSTKAGITLNVGQADGSRSTIVGRYTQDVWDRNPYLVPLSLAGRVPVKVTMAPGKTIEEGDMITSSALPGIGQKATEAGTVIGRAIQPLDPSQVSCTPTSSVESITWPEDDGTNPARPCYVLPDGSYVGKVLIYVNTTYFDPGLAIAQTGDVNLSPVPSELIAPEVKYALTTTSGDNVSTVGTFFKATIANLKAGFISAKDISVDSMTIAGQSLRDYIASVVESLPNNNTGLVQPVVDADIVTTNKLSADLIQPTTSTSSGITIALNNNTNQEVSIKDENDNTVSLLDGKGNAEFTGTVKTEDVQTASISAKFAYLDTIEANTINAKTIRANQIEGMQAILDRIYGASISAQQYRVSELAPQDMPTATESALLADFGTWSASPSATFSTKSIVAETGYFSDYMEVGSHLLIGDVSTNQNMIIDGSSLMTSNDTLFIQPSGVGVINVLAGALVIRDTGDIDIRGNVFIAGNLDVKGDTTLFGSLDLAPNPDATGSSKLASLINITDELGNTVATIDASGSATFKDTTLQKLIIAAPSQIATGSGTTQTTQNNASAGNGTIIAGQTEVIIPNTGVTAHTLIYLTPQSDTENQVLYVKNKTVDQGFTVSMHTPLTSDVTFTYWLIETKE